MYHEEKSEMYSRFVRLYFTFLRYASSCFPRKSEAILAILTPDHLIHLQ